MYGVIQNIFQFWTVKYLNQQVYFWRDESERRRIESKRIESTSLFKLKFQQLYLPQEASNIL